MMTTERQALNKLSEASVSLLRSKLNQGLSFLGLRGAQTTSQIVQYVILGFLLWHLFLFLNIALGLYIAEVYQASLAVGLLIVAAGYTVLILLYILLRGVIQAYVQNRVARKAIDAIDAINKQIDTEPWLVVSPAYREECVIASEKAYDDLSCRSLEAQRKSEVARHDVEVGVRYVQENYADIAISLIGERLEQVVPAYRYVAPLVRQFSSKERTKLSTNVQTARLRSKAYQPKEDSLLTRGFNYVRPYMPYLGVAYNIARPVVSAFLMTQTRGILWKALGFFLRKKRR